NATRNGVQVDAVTMDWGRPALRSRFDAILGSDLVYETPMIGPLFWGVVQLLAPGGRFVLADPGRPPFNAVVGYAESLGFSSEIYAEDEGFVVEFTW
ncbi:MAG: methyltransferase type 11, partial [Victivallales bacterium]|nr:methyltransferase type 11 [Victivallales bacterium]